MRSVSSTLTPHWDHWHVVSVERVESLVEDASSRQLLPELVLAGGVHEREMSGEIGGGPKHPSLAFRLVNSCRPFFLGCTIKHLLKVSLASGLRQAPLMIGFVTPLITGLARTGGDGGSTVSTGLVRLMSVAGRLFLTGLVIRLIPE